MIFFTYPKHLSVEYRKASLETVNSHLPLLLSHPLIVRPLHQIALAEVSYGVADLTPIKAFILGHPVPVLSPPAGEETVSHYLLILSTLHRLVS